MNANAQPNHAIQAILSFRAKSRNFLLFVPHAWNSCAFGDRIAIVFGEADPPAREVERVVLNTLAITAPEAPNSLAKRSLRMKLLGVIY
jgi:hypothetical protein